MEEHLPEGWEVRISKSREGKKYYFNPATKESRWEKPTESKFRASHILVKHRDSRRPSSWKEKEVTR
jgi:NIMA-interacting peptidyl-prolyl cis-trans isomerase 1